MAEIFAQLQDRLGVADYDFEDWVSSKELKVFLGAVVLVPVTYCVVETCKFIWKIRRIGKRVDKFPGPPAGFFTGNLFDHPGANDAGMEWFLDAARKHKTCSRMWFGPFRPCLVAYHPSTVKEILKTAEPKPMSQGGGYKILTPWLGYGLLTSQGNLWARNRRLLTPGFHFDVLKPYVHVYNSGGDQLAELIEKRRKAGSVEICGPVSLATLHTVLKCAFSYEEDVVEIGESHPYVKAVTKLALYTMKRMFNPLCYNDFIYNRTADSKVYYKNVKFVHNVADEIIKNRRKTLAIGGEMKKRYLDFLDILLSARDVDGQGLTDREIRQEVDTFLFEGHDTTASAISWTLYSLAEHPDIQERARQEVNHVLRNKPDEELEWEDLNRLPYLTQCLKEAMRLHSPVPFIGRELSQELTLEGVTLLPGTFIDINICTLHHNPHVWGENHQEYLPDRFTPDNARLMDPHAFIPFSAGPRNCIGQNFAMGEMKVIIAKVLHKFRITVDKSHPIEKIPELVMRARYGIKLNFTPV